MAEIDTLELRRRQALAAAGIAPPAQPAATLPPAPGPTGLLGEIDAVLGSAGRIGQRGLAQTLGAPVDALNAAVNAGLGAVGIDRTAEMLGGRQSLESLLRLFEDPAVAGATAASIAFPPAAPALAAARAAPLLARLGVTAPSALGRLTTLATRFGPTIAAAGAGGAAGGAGEAALQGGTPAEIGSAALRSGAEMATAEGLGLGLGGVAARVAAPALGRMTDIGRRALEFARQGGEDLGAASRVLTGGSRGLSISPADVAPSSLASGLQGVVDGFLPSRAISKSRRQAVVNRLMELGPGEDLNPALRSLIRADTAETALPRAITVADAVSNALGANAAKRLKLDFDAPRTALFDLVTKNPETAAALKTRLGEAKFNDMLSTALERLLSRSSFTVRGRTMLNGEALLQKWRDLPDETKALFPRETQEAVEGLGAFAAASRRLPELVGQPASAAQVAATSVTGALPVISTGLGATSAGVGVISLGSSVLMARSLMDPAGWLNKYLTKEALPAEVLRIIGRETTKADVRSRARGSLENQ